MDGTGTMERRLVGRGAVLLLLAVLLVAPGGAFAQVRGLARGSDEAPPIARRSVDAYASLLRLDADQREAALLLHTEYHTGVRAVRAEMRTIDAEVGQRVREAMRKAMETGDAPDGSVWADARRLREPLIARLGGLEQQFLEELRLLLTEEQAELFPRVVRHRNREVQMREATVAGARIDLVEIAERLGLRGLTGVEPLLEAYELEFDRVLLARASAQQDLRQQRERAVQRGAGMSAEDLGRNFKGLIEADRPLRDINKTYARRLIALLPEDRREALEHEVRTRSFPHVYRESHTSRLMKTSLGFTDLTREQRAQIEELQRAYERDLRVANQRWAAAIEERDDKGESAFVASLLGEADEQVERAKGARLDVDTAFRTRLLTVLSEAQRTRLPEEREQTEVEKAMERMGVYVDPAALEATGDDEQGP